ncbi:MAG TPA: family 78 glycoside hydrolase catalytic domain [Lacipirellulaceae bacterium]|nr:family 78 glycoside hydrolase catalytic domain [Lacipirellulaceae bacterium]
MERRQQRTRSTANQIQVASTVELLEGNEGDLWDSGRVDSDETLHVPYSGATLASSQQAFWRVRSWDRNGVASPWSGWATWTMGIVGDGSWQARWIVAPWTSESLLLRRDFLTRNGIRRAVVHVCGLGHFELSLNGRKVGDNVLSPGWSKYDRTCLYEPHDVTAMLRPGANAVGLSLGKGMYHAERRHRYSKFQGTFGPLRAVLQLELQYDDGSHEVGVSDPTWRVSRGPVTFNDVFGGEDFDARLLQRGWDEPGFDDSAWEPAVELVRPQGALRGLSASAPPLRAIEVIQPVNVRRMSDRQDVVDLGQNASYMPRIRVAGPAGSTIRLTHAEVVHDDGSINRSTCGGNRGPAWWQYTKATDEEEAWFPQFFYAGCRYLQVDKLPAAAGEPLPELVELDGVVVHAAAAPVGQFSCSNDLLNRIRTLVRWAQRSNMVSVLSDCPHREKLGWLEQYHLNGPAIRYEFDVPRIFVKGMQDMADSQTSDGLIPNIAPEYTVFDGTFRAAAEWGAAFLLVPWQQYEFTGDASLLAAYYPRMQKYLEYLATRATDHIVEEGLGDWYDVGPERPGFSQWTPPPITATAFYFQDVVLMSRIAKLLGRADDAKRYAALADEIRVAWQRNFRNDDGTYATGSQCAHALALVMELAEPRDRERVLQAVVDDLRERGNAVTAGDVGFRYLLLALAAGGRSDVIYDLINQNERPGYGYQLRQGATSLTEAWDANHNSSHNHFMLGQITEWFYSILVGIKCDPKGPGFKRILIRPTPVGDLQWAEGRYESVRGPIACRWERGGERFSLRLQIPPNCSAPGRVPARSAESGTEAGGPANDAPGVRFLRRDGMYAVFAVESGHYEFTSEY